MALLLSINNEELFMSDDEYKKQDREIEQEARMGRKFSMADAIGSEGTDFFKGESLVPKLMQVVAKLEIFIDSNVSDSSGALHTILNRQVRTNEAVVGAHFDAPLVALDILVEQILDNDTRFYEFVRQVDAEWGRSMQERPHFQQPSEEPHPDDENTHESVRAKLEILRDKLHEKL